MESSLTDKLRTFKFGKKERENTYKFTPTLQAISYNELTGVQNIMKEYGIAMERPSHIKIAALGSKVVAERLAYANKDSILMSKITRNPLYLLNASVFAAKRESAPAEEKKVEVSSAKTILTVEDGQTMDTAHFERFPSLSNCVNGIFELLVGSNLSKDGVFANLEKLVTKDYPNDDEVLFEALTFEKGYSEETLGQVKEAIQEVLKNNRKR